MNKRFSITLAAIAAGAIFLAACQTGPTVPKGQNLENNQQKTSTESLVNNQPLPHFAYSQMRQNLIEIETAEANGVQTTSFFFNQGQRDPVNHCPSIGVPLPNTASLSNPQQVVDGSGDRGGGNVTIGQMDPNGIYVPASSTGTFVICIDAQGHPYADYWEGFVKTVFAPAKWNTSTHEVELIGPPSFNFTKQRKG